MVGFRGLKNRVQKSMDSLTGVRVRFAPSPTGYLHVGNVRTALFNWLVARHSNGTFILRIEDTDAERSRSEYEARMFEDLRWLGLDWDESVDRPGSYGPYRQSDRYDIYRDYAQRLLARDKAFYCFCTEEDLERVRRQQVARGETQTYSGRCRGISRAEAESRLASGDQAALRLRVRPGTVGFSDLVYGRIDIDTSQISDPVILRSDGTPTYNFSCVVDDVLMRITDVVRGEGHISNTHRQILIYEALEAPAPRFAHLSTVLGPDGQKLSKRHGATSVDEFRAQGYLSEALVNYLALLGWAPPDEGQEVLSLEQVAGLFDLSRVSRSPAIFDRAKLDWMNRSYINRLPPEQLAARAAGYFSEAKLIPAQPCDAVLQWLSLVVDAVRTHIDHLDQLPKEAAVVYGFETDPPVLDPDARDTLKHPGALDVAREFARLVGQREVVTLEDYRQILGQVKASTRQKGKSLFHPIRAALTGRGSGPELEKLIPIYEEGSRLELPRPVMSCRERITAVLNSLEH